jgi:hypothetical protein
MLSVPMLSISPWQYLPAFAIHRRARQCIRSPSPEQAVREPDALELGPYKSHNKL